MFPSQRVTRILLIKPRAAANRYYRQILHFALDFTDRAHFFYDQRQKHDRQEVCFYTKGENTTVRKCVYTKARHTTVREFDINRAIDTLPDGRVSAAYSDNSVRSIVRHTAAKYFHLHD